VSEAASDASAIALSLSRPEAFAAIFDRHFDPIHGYLVRRVGPARADDLASATFTVAFERRRGFRGEADSARPWLFGIATNLMRNERRAEQRALNALSRLRPLTAQATPYEEVDKTRVAALLADLDRDQRDVLLLYAWGELSYEEIAAALEVPLGTVRSRLARARARLRSGRGGADAGPDAQEMSG
jgi:RNA polymerase sigma-70 factor (ECF subfamily)